MNNTAGSMLILLAEPDNTEGLLTKLKALVFGRRVSRVHLAKASSTTGSSASGGTGSNQFLSKTGETLSAQGVDVVHVSDGPRADRVVDYINKNAIGTVVGNRHSGIRHFRIDHPDDRNGQSTLERRIAKGLADSEDRGEKGRANPGTVTVTALLFASLFVFWLVLSGHYHVKYIVIGAVSAALVTLLSRGLLSAALRGGEKEIRTGLRPVLELLRFLGYMPWLIYQIFQANIQVAAIVLNPKLPIDPVILRFKTTMRRNAARVVLANSITLTPGTVTISLDEDRYTVHALLPATAQSLVEAKMQNMVGHVFGEEKEQPPETVWVRSTEELAP